MLASRLVHEYDMLDRVYEKYHAATKPRRYGARLSQLESYYG